MKRLRSGYTTGACAAAAAKAAVLVLLEHKVRQEVEIPFPDGSRHRFVLASCGLAQGERGRAVVIKDAGDDPDVTNGAAIVVEAGWPAGEENSAGSSSVGLILRGGAGVGRVTKPGLAVPVGRAAINPIPEQMIRAAVAEARADFPAFQERVIEITVAVPDGERLAEKTLNYRLGIVGGISILGTTGIVRPISAEAWTATISTSMDVARAAGVEEIVLSTGRTSEAAVQGKLALPVEAYVMMGDYLQYALQDAAKHGFAAVHLSGMWAKILKCAMRIPQTHVRNGALEIQDGLSFLAGIGVAEDLLGRLGGSNTAREIYERLLAQGEENIVRAVCQAAQAYAEEVSGLPVSVYLVHSNKEVVCCLPPNRKGGSVS